MKTLVKFKEFYDEIMSENRRLHKIATLEKYKDDEDIKYYLNFLFNPYITTGISEKKIAKLKSFTLDRDIVLPSATIFNMLDYIKIYNTGADNFLETMKDTLDKIVPLECQDLFCKILAKNLPLGVDVKTINKVMPKLIPTFNVMLANKYFDNPKIVEGKRFALTTKIDGGRIIAIKKNGEVKFYTRQGQEYEGLVDLKEEMEKYMPDDICLDGEITLLDPYTQSDIPDFIEDSLFDVSPRICTCTKLSSKEQYQKTMKITRRDGEKHGVKMLVFDYMDADEFENQRCSRPYCSRNRDLYALLEGSDHKFVYFEKLPLLYVGEDTNEITKWLNTNISNGEEGVMINIWDAPYDFKRTNNLLKVKKMNDIDLEVIGFEEGSNKYSGTLGALLVNYKGYTLKVGSGMSDVLRDEIWANRDEWLGRTIVVQYFEETENQNGGLSLRFPVYLDWRDDK